MKTIDEQAALPAGRVDAAAAVLPPAASPVWRLALLGMLQGAALWALTEGLPRRYQALTPVPLWTALLYAVLALPLAGYLSEQGFRSRRARVVVVAGLGLLFAALGAHIGATGSELHGLSHVGPAHLLPAGVLGFVLLALAAGFDTVRRRFDYPRLFELAWRNAVLVPVAAALTGLLWVLLGSGAALLHSIGIKAAARLFAQPAFIMVVSGGSFGLACGLVLQRTDVLLALRRFALSLTTWMLPLALLFAVIWVLALPFTGVQPLFATRSAAMYLCWFGVLCVTFVNAAWQDGREAPALLRPLVVVAPWCWLAVPVLAVLGDWALWLRIQQHGWTPDRVWGALVAGLVTLYALGYSASLLARRGWFGLLPATNIAAAILQSLALVALLSPLADVRWLSTESQVARLKSGQVDPEDFDWEFLMRKAGPYGEAAVQALAQANGGDDRQHRLAAAAAAALRDSPGTQAAPPRDLERERRQLREQLAVLPQGESLDADFIEAMLADLADDQFRHCLRRAETCLAWRVDLNQDGRPEVVLLSEQHGQVQARIHHRGTAGWNVLDTLGGGPDTLAQWRERLAAGQVQVVAPQWQDVLIDGQRLRVYR